jgi:hypothetical protein
MSVRLSLKTLATRKAGLTSRYGPDDPRTLAAARQLTAARFLAAIAAARAEGLDNPDLRSLIEHSKLPAEPVAA